ncbi:MAG: hypothetical protein EU547_04320 [Promethearchaeota archaeon]|nr:MAG: hypothetical protein EU547_04320 [Candidatus Lokiarchaeota archaeon]
MQIFRLIPQLRENCIIEGKREELSKYKIGDTIFLISNSPTKKYSIISKIEQIKYSEDFQIFIDKRILDIFGEGDEVYILKYNPAEAKEIRLAVSEDYSLISTGDWTSSIKPSLLNKLIDLGQEVSFVLEWEGGAPIIGSGVVFSSLPNPPVYIGNTTKLIIEKVSNDFLSENDYVTMKFKEARVSILEKQIKENKVQILREIKVKNYPNKGIKYSFKATNPKQLFHSIKTIFAGMQQIEKPKEIIYNKEEQDYFASVVYITKGNSQTYQLIDIQIISSGSRGTLIIWITSKKEDQILETINKYKIRIKELIKGVEQKAELLSTQCPECGGDLPIQDINIDGIIECPYCNKISRIPKILRY